ncbi:hypothetical protein [Neisseria chenwenguii]|nr:hypothetical protein [Neisseria chenwenguii]
MAVAATLAPSALQRLYRALEKPEPSYLLVSGLERDAKSLLATPHGSVGYMILGMLDAISNRKTEFDEHFDLISVAGRPVMENFFRLNGLNRMGFFNEATEYLRQMLNSVQSTDNPAYLKPLAHMGMLYGFVDDAGLIIGRLKRMELLEPDQQDELERIYLLLKQTGVSQAVMADTVLAAKKLLAGEGLQIPTYSFGYSVEHDIFIELKMVCFENNTERLAEADESLSRMLVDMEESVDENLINFSISCRPYNPGYGIGS